MQQLVDITWNYNKNSDLYTPVLKLRDLQSTEVQNIDLPGFTFKFSLSSEKYCTGYYKEGKHYACKLTNSSTLLPQMIRDTDFQCFTCEKLQGFKAAFLYNQEPNELAAKYLAQPHYIYLAYFEPGIIKVGTAAVSRKFVRPIEQDALVYTYIAQSDGLTIQKLEHAISKQLNLKETVRSTHKFKFLHQRPDGKKARIMLENTAKTIYARFSTTSDFADWLFAEADLTITALTTQKNIFFPQQEVFLVQEYEHLNGSFLGLRGRFLLFMNGGHIIALDSKRLTGRLVTASEPYEYRVGGDTLGLGI